MITKSAKFVPSTVLNALISAPVRNVNNPIILFIKQLPQLKINA